MSRILYCSRAVVGERLQPLSYGRLSHCTGGYIHGILLTGGLGVDSDRSEVNRECFIYKGDQVSEETERLFRI
jgi:hypothetical protein